VDVSNHVFEQLEVAAMRVKCVFINATERPGKFFESLLFYVFLEGLKNRNKLCTIVNSLPKKKMRVNIF